MKCDTSFPFTPSELLPVEQRIRMDYKSSIRKDLEKRNFRFQKFRILIILVCDGIFLSWISSCLPSVEQRLLILCYVPIFLADRRKGLRPKVMPKGSARSYQRFQTYLELKLGLYHVFSLHLNVMSISFTVILMGLERECPSPNEKHEINDTHFLVMPDYMKSEGRLVDHYLIANRK